MRKHVAGRRSNESFANCMLDLFGEESCQLKVFQTNGFQKWLNKSYISHISTSYSFAAIFSVSWVLHFRNSNWPIRMTCCKRLKKQITIDANWCEIFGLSEQRPHHKNKKHLPHFVVNEVLGCAFSIRLAANVVIFRLLAFCVGIWLYLSNAEELILLIYERRNGCCCLSNRMHDNTADIYENISLLRFNAIFIRQMWSTTKFDQISRGFVVLLLCRFRLVGHHDIKRRELNK